MNDDFMKSNKFQKEFSYGSFPGMIDEIFRAEYRIAMIALKKTHPLMFIRK